jgi:hypothetical protein
MGQQSLILALLAILMVTNPMAINITTGPENALSANLDAICNDLVILAARAQQYYHRPAALGGGGNSFAGLTADYSGLAKLTSMPNGKNANGTYIISCAGTLNSVVLEAVGREMVSGGNYLTMRIVIRDEGRPDSLYRVY